MGWVETELQPDASCEVGGNGQASRLFIVFGVEYSPVTVAAEPTTIIGGISGSEPLPALNSPHPIKAAWKLDRYDVRKDGITLEARALYSLDGRFRFPSPPDPQTAGEVRYGSAVESYKQIMPYATRHLVVQGSPPDLVGPPLTQYTWKLREANILESRRRRLWSVVLTTAQVEPCEVAMDAQNNKLHVLNGRRYRFEAGPITSSGNRDKPYKCEYSWCTDSGTFAPGYQSPDYKFPLGTFGSFPDGNVYQRPPFHDFVVRESDDASIAPEFNLYVPYDDEPSGWTTLVGL